jgi:hypothetical protein
VTLGISLSCFDAFRTRVCALHLIVRYAAHHTQEAERKSNAFFDGVLPPFSNIGNTGRGDIVDAPTLRGIGQLSIVFMLENVCSALCVSARPLSGIGQLSCRCLLPYLHWHVRGSLQRSVCVVVC